MRNLTLGGLATPVMAWAIALGSALAGSLGIAPLALASEDDHPPYVLASPGGTLDSPVCLQEDAELIAIPVFLTPLGDDAAKRLENLRKCRQQLIDSFKQPFAVTAMARSYAPGKPDSRDPDIAPTTAPTYGVLVVRTVLADPEKAESEVHMRCQELSSDRCRIEASFYRLGLADPERFRHELLVKLEKYVEGNRIATPKLSRARVEGLERPLVVRETLDYHHLLVCLPFTLRFDEQQ